MSHAPDLETSSDVLEDVRDYQEINYPIVGWTSCPPS
jgi:hypothetical protein